MLNKEQRASVVLTAPKNATGISHNGEEFYVKDGSIEVPYELKDHLIAQGYRPLDEKPEKTSAK